MTMLTLTNLSPRPFPYSAYPMAEVGVGESWKVRLGGTLYAAHAAAAAHHARLERRLIHLADCTLSAYVGGPEAAPVVLMLHGFTADATLWLPFARALTREYRVVIPDLPGHGGSGFDPAGDYHPIDQARRLFGMLDRLGIRRAHVIGNSMGGFIAAQMALSEPERIGSLGLVCAAGVHAPQPSVMERRVADGDFEFLVPTRAWYQEFSQMAMQRPPHIPHPVTEWLGARFERRAGELAKTFEDFYDRGLLDDHLHEIDMPALVMWGRHDQLIDVSSVQVWADGLADVEVEIFEDLGHMPMVEAPRRTAACYLNFLEH